MKSKEKDKKYKGLRLLPFVLVGLYYLIDDLLDLSRTISFTMLGVMIVISFAVVSFLLKKGAIDQPKKRITMATWAIAGSGIIFIVYLYLINMA